MSGGYVGARWYNVDKEKLNKELSNLKSEGFDVLRTTSVEVRNGISVSLPMEYSQSSQ